MDQQALLGVFEIQKPGCRQLAAPTGFDIPSG
jgi:hypothetical protein